MKDPFILAPQFSLPSCIRPSPMQVPNTHSILTAPSAQNKTAPATTTAPGSSAPTTCAARRTTYRTTSARPAPSPAPTSRCTPSAPSPPSAASSAHKNRDSTHMSQCIREGVWESDYNKMELVVGWGSVQYMHKRKFWGEDRREYL